MVAAPLARGHIRNRDIAKTQRSCRDAAIRRFCVFHLFGRLLHDIKLSGIWLGPKIRCIVWMDFIKFPQNLSLCCSRTRNPSSEDISLSNSDDIFKARSSSPTHRSNFPLPPPPPACPATLPATFPTARSSPPWDIATP